jgi:thioredoxin-like negative regulator of GroEL
VNSFALAALVVSLLAGVNDSAVSTTAVNNTAASDTATTPAAKSLAPNSYAAAYKDAVENNKSIVVLVGADWCPACQSMKTSVMPALAAQGGLKEVSFALVNTDRQSDLANQMLAGNSIPQLVMYEKTSDGWKIKRLVGGQSVSSVEQFIGKPQAIVAKPEVKPEHQASASVGAIEAAAKHN